MTRLIILPVLVLAITVVVSTSPANAGDSDVSGNWYVRLPSGALAGDKCIASFVVDGATLTNSMSCELFGHSVLSGEYDDADGSFHLAGNLGNFAATMDGTVTPSSFSGTWSTPDYYGRHGELDGDKQVSPRGLVRCPSIIEGPDTPARDVSSLDAQLVLQREAGLGTVLPCRYLGDVNIDGEIDSADATLILQYVAGLIEEFPPV
jgi:hypothetical protein